MAEPTFDPDIRTLFRDKDRAAMLSRFDLWSPTDVRQNAQAIVAAVEAGRMPCDGPWDPEMVDRLNRWIDGGTAE